MNAASIAQGVMVGAIMGGLWTGTKAFLFQRHHSFRKELPIVLDYVTQLDPDLIDMFKDFQEFRDLCPEERLPEFDRFFRRAMIEADRQLLIEIQIETEEIVGKLKDYVDAHKLALSCVGFLRQVEELFWGQEVRQDVRLKISEIEGILSMHLTNIYNTVFQ